MVTVGENWMTLGSDHASGSERHVSYPLVLFPPSEGDGLTQAPSGGSSVGSAAFEGLRDDEKQTRQMQGLWGFMVL